MRSGARASRFTLVLRIALVVGGLIDLYVGVLGLFAPHLFGPLLDVPMHDPTIAAFAGGELLVAALVYALALRDLDGNRVLLWVCAFDQLVAVVLPGLGVAHGALPPTWKIVAPIFLQAAMLVIFVAGARGAGRTRSFRAR